MMAITREDNFLSRAAGEWRNSSERVVAIISQPPIEYSVYEEKLINKFHY
jgi:hypothetical protein